MKPSLKNILIILSCAFVLSCSPAWATWSTVQTVSTPTNTTCSTGATTCAISVSSSGVGHIIGISFGCDSISFTGSCTLVSATDNAGTPDTFSTPVCGFDATRGRNVCAAYTLSSTGGATTVTLTRTSSTGYNWAFAVYEIATSAGPAVLDTTGTIDDSMSMTSQPGVALTLTGVNDAIIQAMDAAKSIGALSITNPYSNQVFVSHYASGLAINTASGGAPTFAWPLSGVAAAVAIAFKETVPPSAPTPGMVFEGGVIAKGGMVVTPQPQVLTITSTSPLPNCTISTPFSFTFNVTGGTAPYTWSLFSGSLQPGLSLSSAGVLSGTCTNSSGTASFVVKVQDSASNSTTGAFQQTAQNQFAADSRRVLLRKLAGMLEPADALCRKYFLRLHVQRDRRHFPIYMDCDFRRDPDWAHACLGRRHVWIPERAWELQLHGASHRLNHANARDGFAVFHRRHFRIERSAADGRRTAELGHGIPGRAKPHHGKPMPAERCLGRLCAQSSEDVQR